jgi:hypothetical protein
MHTLFYFSTGTRIIASAMYLNLNLLLYLSKFSTAVILLQRQTLTMQPNLHTRALTRLISVQINHFCQIICILYKQHSPTLDCSII